MRINIAGYYGFGNCGDEGILQAIMDSLGRENDFIVSTSLPIHLHDAYKKRMKLTDLRHIYDTRIDYDAYILGGGNLNWGYGWRQALSTFASGKVCMNYGVGYSYQYGSVLYHPKLSKLYGEFLRQFDAVTVRDVDSLQLLRDLGVDAQLTMCPSVNLREEPFDLCDLGIDGDFVAVCPRFEDSDPMGAPTSNGPQIHWISEKLGEIGKPALLIPFSRKDIDGNALDLMLCNEISWDYADSLVFKQDDPRKIKYAISKSALVISGGRYHAVLWAKAHDVHSVVYPGALERYHKITALGKTVERIRALGHSLSEHEGINAKTFWEAVERHK